MPLLSHDLQKKDQDSGVPYVDDVESTMAMIEADRLLRSSSALLLSSFADAVLLADLAGMYTKSRDTRLLILPGRTSAKWSEQFGWSLSAFALIVLSFSLDPCGVLDDGMVGAGVDVFVFEDGSYELALSVCSHVICASRANVCCRLCGSAAASIADCRGQCTNLWLSLASDLWIAFWLLWAQSGT
ncbi:hypothetical protein Nepgr_015827 [Nepenthes gracilis]|uniref:Uncharacterized protein n=1 Tax=Nepenthes gracilis TaxID=150966 RepID=A0AAD3SP78_NEPGR|nr:hypothetical protein Nepgr_015827 [Nepenthes gracilis]